MSKRARALLICVPAILLAASCHAIVGIDDEREDTSGRPGPTSTSTTGTATAGATSTTATAATTTADAASSGAMVTAASSGTGVLTYEDEVAADGPVLWFRFEQASGDPVDSVSGAAIGNLIGQGTYTAGRIGTALRLNAQADGSTDAVEVAPQTDGFAFADDAPFTIEAWFRAPGLVGEQFIFSRQITPGDSGMQFGYSLEVQNFAANPYLIGFWGSDYVEKPFTNPGDYHHVALVHDGEFLWLALDGTHTVEALDGVMYADFEERLFLGASPVGGYAFIGEIDELAIYDEALPMARLDAHYHAAP